MPPALANDLAYCSLRNERHTPTAGPPPNGPSPWTPASMWLNIELRNCASKLTAAARALALGSAFGLAPAPVDALSATLRASEAAAGAARVGEARACWTAITSPRYRPEWRRRP